MINKEIIEKKEGDYNTLISSIGTVLEEARKSVYTKVNQILVKTYWHIGKKIIEFEQKKVGQDMEVNYLIPWQGT